MVPCDNSVLLDELTNNLFVKLGKSLQTLYYMMFEEWLWKDLDVRSIEKIVIILFLIVIL